MSLLLPMPTRTNREVMPRVRLDGGMLHEPSLHQDGNYGCSAVTRWREIKNTLPVSSGLG